MKKKGPIAGLLIAQLLGCAVTGKECTPPEPPSDKAATLIIYRPAQSMASLYSAPISIDDCIIGSLADGSVISHRVTAGAVKLRAEKRALAMGGDAEIRTGVSVGDTVYVRFAFLTPTAPQFMISNQAVAEREMPSLRGMAR